MATTSTKIGHSLAKVLGIKLEYRNELGHEGLTRGESVFSVDSADSYVEREPTISDWFYEHRITGHGVKHYFINLFPFLKWIGFYNLQWFAGDLVAGITVGAVVVPQSMAYAKLAEVPVYYGLYSSFMGVLIYWFFATSKDITIGPVAVMSTVTGTIVLQAAATNPRFKENTDGAIIPASALAIVCGAIVCFIGLARLGWLVNFISLTAISAFMTGSAINIAVGQIPALMGITGFSNRDSTYKVVINILKHLGRSTIDASLGLTALLMLYGVRSIFTYLAKRSPKHRKAFFFASTLRTAFVILLYTLISYLANRHLKNHNYKNSKFAILGPVPRGFTHAKVPEINTDIIKLFTSQLPAAVIVLLIEHISISKSFGRVNNYKIDPSQELVAIGVSNLLGPFLGAYPATGSFSRTAIKSKAGVRTPLAGVITALVVLLAIYALPAVFFYIPSAALSAVIIHAVGDLITPPNTVYQFWRVSPLEVLIFFAGVIVTVFTTIEDGVYVTISTSAALLLWRIFKARGRFVGKIQVHSVIGDHVMQEQKHGSTSAPDGQTRNVFLPLDHGDGSNPGISVRQPYPGIFIYRFSEGFNYPNADHYLEHLTDVVFAETRRTNPNTFPRLGDRPWNDPGVSRKQGVDTTGERSRPTLKAVILDFSSVNNVDITSVQQLIDVRNQLDRYAAPDTVHWHFAHVNNRWTKRALAAAGFGYPTQPSEGSLNRWKPIFSVADIGGSNTSAAAEAEYEYNRRRQPSDVERIGHYEQDSDRNSIDKAVTSSQAYHGGSGAKNFVVAGINRPLFHIDLTTALQSAIANVEHRVLDSDSDTELQKPA